MEDYLEDEDYLLIFVDVPRPEAGHPNVIEYDPLMSSTDRDSSSRTLWIVLGLVGAFAVVAFFVQRSKKVRERFEGKGC